jgi:hypothetical protein
VLTLWVSLRFERDNPSRPRERTFLAFNFRVQKTLQIENNAQQDKNR